MYFSAGFSDKKVPCTMNELYLTGATSEDACAHCIMGKYIIKRVTQNARPSQAWFFYNSFRFIKDLHFVKGSCLEWPSIHGVWYRLIAETSRKIHCEVAPLFPGGASQVWIGIPPKERQAGAGLFTPRSSLGCQTFSQTMCQQTRKFEFLQEHGISLICRKLGAIPMKTASLPDKSIMLHP